VFIDSEYETWNMDPRALEKALKKYPQAKAVILAHLYGTPEKIDEIKDLCEKYNVPLIEDAAESLGATYKGKQTGTFGKYSALSLVVLKNRMSDIYTGIRSGGAKAT
jgi:dTDP-4-amino-4,6-dideoxygalactose transaminase